MQNDATARSPTCRSCRIPACGISVCAEQGNCLGKKCQFYEKCFWQAAKRRMQGGNILVVNHALFFSDLALRMAGVNYLPKYDLVILDEAHTVEDVAGQHFGLEDQRSVDPLQPAARSTTRSAARAAQHPRRAPRTTRSATSSSSTSIIEHFFERCIAWQETAGRGNGRVHEKDVDRERSVAQAATTWRKHLKADEHADRGRDEDRRAERDEPKRSAAWPRRSTRSLRSDDGGRGLLVRHRRKQRRESRVSLHAAPVNSPRACESTCSRSCASVVMTSATLCTAKSCQRLPVARASTRACAAKRRGSVDSVAAPTSPTWTLPDGIYAVTFRLADSLPQIHAG